MALLKRKPEKRPNIVTTVTQGEEEDQTSPAQEEEAESEQSRSGGMSQLLTFQRRERVSLMQEGGCGQPMRPSRATAPAASDDRQGDTSSTSLTIGQVSRQTGVSAKTIRYYESLGLLPRPPRQANQYRQYHAADVNRLRLLQRIRLLGVPLAQARHLLARATDARCADVRQDLLALVDARLAALDREMEDLRRLRLEVEPYQRALSECRLDAEEPFAACADMRCIGMGSDGPSGQEEQHEDGGL